MDAFKPDITVFLFLVIQFWPSSTSSGTVVFSLLCLHNVYAYDNMDSKLKSLLTRTAMAKDAGGNIQLVGVGTEQSKPEERRSIGSGLTEEENIFVKNQLNKYRHAEGRGIRSLVWDSALAEVAQNHATKCVFEWNRNRGHGTGETIFKRMSLNVPNEDNTRLLEIAVDAWAAQKRQYDPMTNSCNGMCGSYLQVIWKDTKNVGCGLSRCSSETGLPWAMIVCNYSPLYVKMIYDYYDISRQLNIVHGGTC